MQKNIFIRGIPKKAEGLSSKFLEDWMNQSGFENIKSCKLSLSEDYKSNGYGFICFEQQEDKKKCLEDVKKSEEQIR